MGWIESNLGHLEQRVEYLFRMFDRFEQRLRSVEQGLQRAFQQDQGAGGGGEVSWYCANHVNLGAATGTFPTITPTSGSYTVYQARSGALVSLGSKTVYNFMPDATDNTKRQILGKNPDNTYSIIAQSCTAG